MALQGKTIQHPNFHVGPSVESETLEVLGPGIEVHLIGLENDYFRVILPDNRQGFIHRDLIVVDDVTVPNPVVGGAPAIIGRGITIQHPNLHVGPSENSDVLSVLDPEVPLDLLGLENDYWHVRLPNGRDGFVHTDLVVAARGGTGPQDPPGTLVAIIGNPFDQAVHVTESSRSGHHTPFGGDGCCDLDTAGPSRGTPVHFRISSSNGVPLRGRVEVIGLACKSQRLEDGGRWVRLVIQKQDQGQWVSSGKQVNYVHLDPISDGLAVGQTVEDGFELGRLGPVMPAGFDPNGPAAGGCRHPAGSPMLDEYHSTCAFHSHTHVEGNGSAWVNEKDVVCGPGDPVMRIVL